MGSPTFFLFFLFFFFLMFLPPHFIEHSVSHNIVMNSRIGVIFCRNMLMDSLQGQLQMVWVKSFFIELFE